MEIKDLEAKIELLIDLCTELQKQNAELLADRDDWLKERTRLIEKNELARAKVEAMIARLRSQEGYTQ